MSAKKILVVPKYRIHKATNRAFIWWNKQRNYLGKANSPESIELYNQFVADILTNKANPGQDPSTVTPGVQTKKTIGELVLAYLTDVKGAICSDEYDNFRYSCRPLRALYGHTPINKFGSRMLKEVRKQMVRDGLCRKTVNHRISRIKRIFKWGVEEEMVTATLYHTLMAVEGLKPGQTEAKETDGISTVPDEHVDALLPYLSPINVAMVKTQRLTGLRPGEVCKIRPCDIDRSSDVWLYRPFSHKGTWREQDRVVPIGPRAQEVLKPFLDRPDDVPLFSPAESYAALREQQAIKNRSKRKTKVYPSELRRLEKQKAMKKDRPTKPQSYNTRSYGKAIAYGFKRAEKEGVIIPAWSPNQLRKNRATEVRKDYGLEAAQVILGHSKADVTQIYAERDLNKAIEIAKETG